MIDSCNQYRPEAQVWFKEKVLDSLRATIYDLKERLRVPRSGRVPLFSQFNNDISIREIPNGIGPSISSQNIATPLYFSSPLPSAA